MQEQPFSQASKAFHACQLLTVLTCQTHACRVSANALSDMLKGICRCIVTRHQSRPKHDYLHAQCCLPHCPERFLVAVTSAMKSGTDWRHPDMFVAWTGLQAVMGPWAIDKTTGQVHVVWDAIAV